MVPLLTSSQAAKLLNLPTHRVLKMIHRSELLAFKVGSHWRIPRSEVAKVIGHSQELGVDRLTHLHIGLS